MPSFDIVSKVDTQTLDNAVNTVKKEITTRFDFKDSHVNMELNKKDLSLNVEVESEMKMTQVIDVLISRTMRQGLDANIYDLSKEPYQSGKKGDSGEKRDQTGRCQEDCKTDKGFRYQGAGCHYG